MRLNIFKIYSAGLISASLLSGILNLNCIKFNCDSNDASCNTEIFALEYLPLLKSSRSNFMPDCTAKGNCYIFLSTATNGNMGGIAGADAKCAADAIASASGYGNPSDYKALLMAEDGTRNISTNWILTPNASYRSLNNLSPASVVFTTNANGQINFPINLAITNPGGNSVYTGIISNNLPNPGFTCQSWTNSIITNFGYNGVSNDLNNMLSSGSWTCDTNLVIYCVGT